MELAIANLKTLPEFLLIDGRGFKFKINYKNIIDGDFKVFCIAAASIIAKVTRDKILIAAAVDFPEYQFDQNKGYGTLSHYQAICKNGICAFHRQSFHPMKDMV
jgi:ribonuclease HII